MIKRDEKPLYSESQWQKVVELSLRGEVGCELEAAEKVAKILMSFYLPDRILMEVKQAVTMVMEKEMSNSGAGQAQQIFTILVQTQVSQTLEMPANEADSSESHSRSRGWGFFLTEKRTPETELGNKTNHVVINVHLYHEGQLA